MSLVIACDLDGVTLDFNGRWIRLYQEWFGAEPTNQDGWNGIVEGTHFETELEFFRWFARAGGWFDMDWIPGAPGGIDRLVAAGHRVQFVTSRKADTLPGTNAWHQRWYPDLALISQMSDKASVKSHVYIDDAPHQAKNISAAGKPVILFDQTWNSAIEENELITRAYGWDDVLVEVERLSTGAPKKAVKK